MFSSIFILKKLDLLTISTISVCVLFIINLILAIVYSVKYSSYKKLVSVKETDTPKNRDLLRKCMISKNVFISLSSVLFAIIIVLCYFKLKNKEGVSQKDVSQKDVAKDIIQLSTEKKTEEGLEKADLLCDKLFNKSPDKIITSQYFDMKEKRPEAEVRNLCSNYAKTIINLH